MNQFRLVLISRAHNFCNFQKKYLSKHFLKYTAIFRKIINFFSLNILNHYSLICFSNAPLIVFLNASLLSYGFNCAQIRGQIGDFWYILNFFNADIYNNSVCFDVKHHSEFAKVFWLYSLAVRSCGKRKAAILL